MNRLASCRCSSTTLGAKLLHLPGIALGFIECCLVLTQVPLHNLKDAAHTHVHWSVHMQLHGYCFNSCVYQTNSSFAATWHTLKSQGLLSVLQHYILKYELLKGNNAYQVNLYGAFPVLLVVHSSIINHNIQPSKMLNYFFESTYSKSQG